MLTLKQPSGPMPQHGWPFKCQYTGHHFAGTEANWQGQALRVYEKRRANRHLKMPPEALNLASIEQEVLSAKFETHPHLFVGHGELPRTIQQAQAVPQVALNSCPQCGSAQAKPIYCGSCSTKKLLSWKCTSCGRERKA